MQAEAHPLGHDVPHGLDPLFLVRFGEGVLASQANEFDVAIHIQNIASAGKMIECRRRIGCTIVHVMGAAPIVPHHRQRALPQASPGWIIDIRDEKTLDALTQPIPRIAHGRAD